MKTFFLHGMGGSPADWALVQQKLAGEALAFPAAPDFATLVERLKERFLTEKEPFGLVGYSLGGRVAIALSAALLQAGHPPRKIALLGAGLGFEREEERFARQQSDDTWAALVRSDLATFWQRWYDQPLFQSFRALPSLTQESWLQSRRLMDPVALSRQWEAWGPARHPYLKPVLKQVAQSSIDCLYLAGEQDTKYKLLGESLRAEGLRTLLIPDAGHLLPLEAPHAVAAALRHFFERESHGEKHRP